MGRLVDEWKNKSLGQVLLDHLRTWYRTMDKPDPWPEEIDRAVHSPDALPVCHHCFLPQEYDKNRWFCSACGHVTGPYNNVMPFIRIFSVGEVFRAGVGREARYTFLSVTGYISAGFLKMLFLFPFYAYRLLRNLHTQIQRAKKMENENESQRLSGLFVWGVVLCLLLIAPSLLIAARAFYYTIPTGPRIHQLQTTTYSMPIRIAETNYPPDTEVFSPMPTQTTRGVVQRKIFINGPM